MRLARARWALALAQLLLLLAAAAASQVTFSVSEAEQQYLNALHAPEAMALAKDLQHVFLELDVDADGELSDLELSAHEADGTLLAAERTLAHAFDLDNSGTLSQAELMLAPHTLHMLEMHVGVGAQAEAQFVELVPAARSRQTAEARMAAAAFDGFEQPTPMRRLKNRRAPVAEWGEDQSFSELSSWSSEQPADGAVPPQDAAPASDAAATPGVISAPRTPGQTRRARGGKRGAAPLPVSLFGVPSVADEECVMCQYFVQRIQNDIASRLDAAPGASQTEPPMGGAGLQGSAVAAQQALKVRNTNRELQRRPGGRGIVRVVSEDILSRLCAVDRMPQLFAPYCSGFGESNTLNAVRKALFFNIPTVEVCSQAALCRDDSYINTNAAVHATKTSLFLNGQRGICGMLGGARDRPNSREGMLLNAVCAAHGVVFGEMIQQ